MGVKAFVPFGYEGTIVDVEVDLRRGIPALDIVGVSDDSVGLLRDELRQGIMQNGMEFPPERTLISVSPADIKKTGSQVSFAAALAVLAANDGLQIDSNVLVLGEIEPVGSLKPARGSFAAMCVAQEQGIKQVILPKDDTKAAPSGIDVFYATDLKSAYEYLKTVKESVTKAVFISFDSAEDAYQHDGEEGSTLDDIHHAGLKFAMAAAIAGHHHMLVTGAPGCGKTMTLQRAPEILPELSYDESMSVTRLWSIAGLDGCGGETGMKVQRPFRMPHQTASIEGMCGGGTDCRPGEISLAHNGILFLDEAAEFRSSVLQMLRVPLESHNITLSRAGRSTTYPANFQLFMATNPCPCGNYGSPDKVCLCSAKSVEQYWKKFSAPLLDRVAIRYDMYNELLYTEYSVKELRQIIRTAWKRQYARQGKLNGDLLPEETDKYIHTAPDFEKVLVSEAERHNFSVRTIQNLRRLAQTVADMAEADVVTVEHLKVTLELHGKQIENILGNA